MQTALVAIETIHGRHWHNSLDIARLPAEGHLIFAVVAQQLPKQRGNVGFAGQRSKVYELAAEFRMLVCKHPAQAGERGLRHRQRSCDLPGRLCVSRHEPEAGRLYAAAPLQGLDDMEYGVTDERLCLPQRVERHRFTGWRVETQKVDDAVALLIDKVCHGIANVLRPCQSHGVASTAEGLGQVAADAATITQDQPRLGLGRRGGIGNRRSARHVVR